MAMRRIEYEIWNRIHSRGLVRSHAKEARALIGRVALIELAPAVLARALEAFPVRTLDAPGSIEFLRGRRQSIELASYDDRLVAAARALGIELWAL